MNDNEEVDVNKYTVLQIDTLLNGYYRKGARHKPWPDIAKEIGMVATPTALDRLRWGIITGYGARISDTMRKRRQYHATMTRVGRVGWDWEVREVADLKTILEGAGRMREPVCDVEFAAVVLARSVEEVAAKWKEIKDPLDRKGFFVLK